MVHYTHLYLLKEDTNCNSIQELLFWVSVILKGITCLAWGCHLGEVGSLPTHCDNGGIWTGCGSSKVTVTNRGGILQIPSKKKLRLPFSGILGSAILISALAHSGFMSGGAVASDGFCSKRLTSHRLIKGIPGLLCFFLKKICFNNFRRTGGFWLRG